MVRTYNFNPSTQTSAFLPGSSQYRQSESFPPPNQQHFRSLSPPSQRQKFTREEECPFSMHYKNIASQDDRQRMMMPEQNNSKVFGIESVVIDGQCFYRLLDQQLNKALNEQFLTLKPIPNQSNYPSPSKRTETDFKPQISYSDPHHQQHPTDPMMHPNQFMEPQHNFHRFEDDLKLRLGTSSTIQNEKMIEDLPWARGNPQPKNGKRGTLEWSFGQRSNPFNEPTYKPYNGWLNDSFVSKRPDNLYQTTSKDAYSYLNPPKPVNYPVNFNNTYDSYHSEPLNNYINPFTYGTTPEERKRYEKEQHRIDLLRQIEDNNRRKMLEKQRDWEEDQRERWRSEVTLRRQREEVQKERDEVRERQFAAEMKAQRAEFEGPRRKNSLNRARETTPKRERRKKSPTESELGPRLEWWEKKATWQDRQISSPAIPVLRNNNQQNEIPSRQSRVDSSVGYSASRLARRSASIENQETNVDRSMSLQSRQSRSQSRHSRHSYQPSLVSRSGSNGSALRNLSATRHQLEHEFQKVQAAVKKNQYDSRVFD